MRTITPKLKLTFVLVLLAAAAAAAILALVALPGAVRARTVSFPSGPGGAELVRTRVELLDTLKFETWRHPASLSYSLWLPFERLDPSGDTLQCRAGMEGWLRTVSRHRNLFDLHCVCERPHLHHDRETPCPGVP